VTGGPQPLTVTAEETYLSPARELIGGFQ